MVFQATIILLLLVIVYYVYVNHIDINNEDNEDDEESENDIMVGGDDGGETTSKATQPSSNSDPVATAPDTTTSSKAPNYKEGYTGYLVNYNDDVLSFLDPNIYAENILRENLKGTNILHTHRQFSMSVKPNTHQPSRFFERDDYQDPNGRVGFWRHTPFFNIDRSIPGRTIPSQGWDNMFYSTNISFSKKDDYSTRATSNAPTEVY